MDSKKYDDAIQDFNASLELSPDNEIVYRNRSMAYSRKKEFAKAVEDLDKVIRLNPDSAYGQNGLAWILATCPDDGIPLPADW